MSTVLSQPPLAGCRSLLDPATPWWESMSWLPCYSCCTRPCADLATTSSLTGSATAAAASGTPVPLGLPSIRFAEWTKAWSCRAALRSWASARSRERSERYRRVPRPGGCCRRRCTCCSLCDAARHLVLGQRQGHLREGLTTFEVAVRGQLKFAGHHKI